MYSFVPLNKREPMWEAESGFYFETQFASVSLLHSRRYVLELQECGGNSVWAAFRFLAVEYDIATKGVKTYFVIVWQCWYDDVYFR